MKIMHTPLDSIAVQLLRAARCALEGDGHNVRNHIERVTVLLRRDSSQLSGRSSNRLPTWRTNRLFCYIENNLSQRIHAAQLASLVGLSQGHLMRVFKSQFGFSMRVYINCRRIALAQRLMVSTDAPLVEVSLKCGMYDQAHFTRTFHKLVGETPSRWREMQRAVALGRAPAADSIDELLERYDRLQGTVRWNALRGALTLAEVSRDPPAAR